MKARLLHIAAIVGASLAAVALIDLALIDVAEARVGGGQGFSSGSRGGSGGGGIDAGLIWLLIRMAFYYPHIGIPILLLMMGFAWWQAQTSDSWSRGVRSSRHDPVYAQPNTVRRKTRKPQIDTEWQKLERLDRGLSRPVLLDFLSLVYRRSWAAVSNGQWGPISPFAGPSVQEALLAVTPAGTDISDVVTASTSIEKVKIGRTWTTLDVLITSSKVIDGQPTYMEESWRFRRATAARSLPPEDALRLGCPSCGAAVEADSMGRCTNCDTPITEGQLQWQAVGAAVRVRRPVAPPEVSFWDGTEEDSVHLASVVAPDLDARIRSFNGRHPDFDTEAWEARVHRVFLSLQESWSANRWELARPHVTDATYNQLRFWIERYRRAGLRNRLDNVRITQMQVVDVRADAWYESITVRFWGAMKDAIVEESTGKVVGGNAKLDRHFSEYWTFLRAVGSGVDSKPAETCPSCGAPLDRINAAGTCGYCDSVITTGRFDWVLSRIDQAEAYRG